MTFYEMRPFGPDRPFELDEDDNPVSEEVVSVLSMAGKR